MTKRNSEYVSIRMDADLKRRFEAFCESCGMTVSGAVCQLVKETIEKRGIPFQITAAADMKGVRNDEEKQAERISVRVAKETREEFSEVCRKVIKMPMGRLIKIFMVNCINNGKLPF